MTLGLQRLPKNCVAILLSSLLTSIFVLFLYNTRCEPCEQNVREQNYRQLPLDRVNAADRQTKRSTSGNANCKMPANPRFYSQSNEDLALFEHYFKNPLVCRGTFVEIGAQNGLALSISKFYEDYLGWNGVLIEGNPVNAAKLMKNRKKTKNFAMAVCPKGQNEVEFVGRFGVGGIVDQMEKKQYNEFIKPRDKKYTVPCRPIGDMLNDAGLTEIDLFSLDVEGGELLVLQTMDWSISVKVFIIEMYRESEPTARDLAIDKLLIEQGFKTADWKLQDYCQNVKYCATNTVYVNTMYPELH